MTRIKISVCIILLLTAMGIFSGIWTNKKCSYFIENISAIRELIISGESDIARNNIKKLEKEWEQYRNYASLIVNNEKLSETDRIFITFLTEENDNEILTGLDEISHMLELLRQSEIPLITSIL